MNQALTDAAEANGVGPRRSQRAGRRVDCQAESLERLHAEKRLVALGDDDRGGGASVTDPDHDGADLGLDTSAVGEDDGLLRSEEHTSELQSHSDLVCRLLLEKK